MEFTVGQKVRLHQLPPFVKTAETMPMLRPASVLALGETGVILGRNPGGYWAVRFPAGAFLLETRYLEAVC